MDPVRLIINFIWYLTQAMTYAIIGRAILSWFPVSPTNPLVQILDQITEPFLAPLRRVVPRVGLVDITPMVAIFILWAIQGLLAGVV